MTKNNHIILQAAIVATLLTDSIASYAANNLCSPTEKVVFNCQLKQSKKFISVCSSQTLTRDSGYIQYRFGTKNHLELNYPQTKANSQNHFFWADKRFYQSILHELTFENRGYLYTLSQYDVSEVMNEISGGAQGGGVTVQRKDDPRYTSLKCSTYPEGEFDLQGIVRDAEELIEAKP